MIEVLRELREDDPEGGYRVLADDLHDLGYQISKRRVWRLCHADGPDQVWVTDERGFGRVVEVTQDKIGAYDVDDLPRLAAEPAATPGGTART